MTPTPCRMVTLVCGLSLFQAGSAWLPVSARPVATAPRACASSQLRAAAGDSAGRPDLLSMKRSFETSMDNKLIMEYVTVSRLHVCTPMCGGTHLRTGEKRVCDTCFERRTAEAGVCGLARQRSSCNGSNIIPRNPPLLRVFHVPGVYSSLRFNNSLRTPPVVSGPVCCCVRAEEGSYLT